MLEQKSLTTAIDWRLLLPIVFTHDVIALTQP